MEIDVTNFENPEDDSIERIYYKSHATCQKSRDIKTKYYFDELGRNISISKSGKAILTKNITYNEFESPVDTDYHAHRLSRLISDYLRLLSDRKRFIFISRYYCADRISEIARMLQVSDKTVFRELTDIKEGLKALLIKEGYYHEG